ncbi:phosphodiester glycosidase family protein [Oceanitalea stevensii]|uniref:Phosphodiester glycosidase family protein n=1 Tax=Oceanitalea stevensii TaxID=2763072 RepID=A0ABR8Z4N1_9MICO|nr:phosphodiester glycosidase family protein [Oceanitalea stevensii]MBD8063210.1 phosphodiester glycosidase family protein [Oceanitalea stevensii]
MSQHRARRGAAVLAATTAAVLTLPLVALAQPPRATDPGRSLPLGAEDLPEVRETEQLAPGVTLTRIVRGETTASYPWTVEVSVPAGSGSPDPDAPPTALRDRASAEEVAAELRDAGLDARVEEVRTEPVADFAGGSLGWRVRVGSFADRAAADAARAHVVAAGHRGSTLSTAWDADSDDDRGPWRLDVLTVDPRHFRGEVAASLGPDVEQRETTSELAALSGALAAVNGGFFVLDPQAGAPGDPAGVSVVDGELLSEPVGERPALLLRPDARRTEVERLGWEGELRAGGTRLPLDGLNRVPGLVRNCGGLDDLPTTLPLHDVTCTDPDELVVFTETFAERTPAGEGVEAVLDRHGRVTELRDERGGPVPDGGSTVQATGDLAPVLRSLAEEGGRLDVRTALTGEDGRTVHPSRYPAVVNGGPELVRDGERHVTAATDGMVHPDNPSFYYGWAHKRNPRTLAGVDDRGRLVLVTADGRSTDALGLSIPEAADVAVGLGLREALNLDGGGSTAMVAEGRLLTVPSDAAGERPVGDAVLVLPGRPTRP